MPNAISAYQAGNCTTVVFDDGSIFDYDRARSKWIKIASSPIGIQDDPQPNGENTTKEREEKDEG